MAVELPEDAEGREIPPDTEIPYGENGNECEVHRRKHPVRRTVPQRKRRAVTTDRIAHDASDPHPTPPDSRERPGEDLHAAEARGDPPDPEDPVRAYARDIGGKCVECEPHAGDRTIDMRKGIASRIHGPGGEGR